MLAKDSAGQFQKIKVLCVVSACRESGAVRNAEICKDALVEDRAVAGRSDLLQLSIEGLVEKEGVGPWIPVQWNIVYQVSAQMMLWHPTNVQQIHRTEMTLQAIIAQVLLALWTRSTTNGVSTQRHHDEDTCEKRFETCDGT